jgi:hypothetical protein
LTGFLDDLFEDLFTGFTTLIWITSLAEVELIYGFLSELSLLSWVLFTVIIRLRVSNMLLEVVFHFQKFSLVSESFEDFLLALLRL